MATFVSARTVWIIALAVLAAAGPFAGRGAEAAVTGCWPGWRGDGDGVSAETDLPTRWDRSTNILWRRPLDGEGNSSPIVWGDKLFLTDSPDEGQMRRILCFAVADGKLLWTADFPRTRKTKNYRKTGRAAPTPITDGERVYAFFDSPGLTAVSMRGEPAWPAVDLGPFTSHYNMAASPALCDDLVIVVCDHNAGSFIVAVEKATGRVRWRRERSVRANSASPLVITVDGRRQIIVAGATVIAYGDDGAELWRCAGMKSYVTPTPLFDGRLVYVTSGRNGPTMAIDPRGRGDVSRTHVRMHAATGGPYVPSPIIYPRLMLPADNGLARFLDADGAVVAQHRTPGRYSASPVAADGKIYWTDEKGRTVVLGVGEAPAAVEVLAVNPLEEKVLASPAIAGGRLYIRTVKALYCIAGRAAAGPPAREPEAGMSDVDFATLAALYEASMAKGARRAGSEEEAAARIEVISRIARVGRTAEAAAYLGRIAQADPHWDVREEAVKLLSLYGATAEKPLIRLLTVKDRRGRPTRPFTRIIAAGRLGEMGSIAAVEALRLNAADRDSLVRLNAVEALGKIAAAHTEQVPAVAATLLKALADKEAVVVRVAARALAPLGDVLGDQREPVRVMLKKIAAGDDGLAAKAAAAALARWAEAPAN